MNSKRRKPLCIAHRGAFVEAPENTLKSFKLAMEMGADMIELDVRLTKDRKVVVIHDDTIDRTSNGSGAVRDYTLDELKQFDFGEGEKIPTLEEVFELIKGNVLVNVEIKEMDMAKEVVEIIEKYNMADKVLISSFLHPVLLDVKRLNPTIKTGILFTCRPVSVTNLARDARAEFVHPFYDTLDKQLIDEAHKNGLEVNVWTVDDEELMQKFIDWGVDGIITDVPDVFLDIRDNR
ncbi:MAG: glycerophosphodiester phosphodiesterase [Candidatus Asgardarchaeia archaeon]